MKIPRLISQVWIGPLPAPEKWMRTWPKQNPDWRYERWDNARVFGRTWRNQHLIDEYVRQYEEEIKGKGSDGRDRFMSARGVVYQGEKATAFAWHVIADLLRYEILFEYGGYMPGADSACIAPIPANKFGPDTELYTLNTGHLFREQRRKIRSKYTNGRPQGHDLLLWRRYAAENASPPLAAAPGNEFLRHCIEELGKLQPHELGEAVDTTGNVFMGRMLKKYPPQNALIPEYTLRRLRRNNHSIHYAGTTKNRYARGR